MKYKALTIAREYGSGGAEIARMVADSLGWRLLDSALLAEVSRRAQAPMADAVALDERVDPWLHRISRPLWQSGGDVVSGMAPVKIFDADAAAELADQVIEEAYRVGDCVIVGRGAQCVLRGKKDVFHVFVYAGAADRLQRLRARAQPGADANALLHSVDERRLEYVRRHYGENRLDPHLYDLMINAHDRSEAAAKLILTAMEAMG
jgi:hypothetical protein